MSYSIAFIAHLLLQKLAFGIMIIICFLGWTLIMHFRPTELNQPIPAGVTSLDLSDNYLGQGNVDELVAIMRAIPPSVTYLDLSGNELGQGNVDELVAIMRAIPPSVISLNLTTNFLGQNTVAEFEAIMAAIPQSVTSLNLHDNSLWQRNVDEFKAIMAAIPQSVTFLDLSLNGLCEKTLDDLVEISTHMSFVINIRCEDLSPDKLTALSLYNGHGIKATKQVLDEKLPAAVSLEVLSFLWPCSDTDIQKVLTQETPPQTLPSEALPTQEVQWLNRYRVGSFLALVSAAAYAAEAPYESLVLGLIAAICLLSCESNNKQNLRPRL